MRQSLSPGTRLGRYEIVALMDAGGMGEVYRAHDAELGRAVAVKILPTAFADHPDRLRRFELEARAAAALNHPNILAVYDVGRHDGTPYIVSELLEGQSLRARLDGAALPLRKAVEFGIQIAEGLAAAHDKGIVHRDLKPENIFVTRDERLKILDFGLAKLVELDSVTLTAAPHTADGAVLGTVGYLSPEQASGLPADHRSDVFSVGAILFEMVMHRRAFARATAAQTLTAVLEDDPTASTAVGAGPSARVMNLVRRCLDKSPEHRFQSARDLALVLSNELADGGLGHASGASAARRRVRAAWTVAAVALVGMGMALAWPWMRRTPPVERGEVRLDVVTPPALDPNALLSLALSPDGEKLVFVAPVDGANRLWVRTMSSPTATALKGTDGAAFPFWKPDSQSIGFFAKGMLNRIDLAGGAVRELTRANAGRGGAWSQDGTIVFTPGNIDPLYRIPDTGGASVQVTRLSSSGRQGSHRFPQFLPDARHIIFFVTGEDAGVYSADISTGEPSRIVEADTSAVLGPDGHLLFIQRGTLYGVRFDERRLVVEGDPFPVAEEVTFQYGKGAFSSSMAGTVAYRTGGRLKDQLVWLDRSGKSLRSLFPPDPGGFFNADVAADGRVLLQRSFDGGMDIWLSSGISGQLSRATVDKATHWCPVWAPGGSQFAFASNRTGVYDLYRKPVAGPEEVLLKSSDTKIPTHWSRDGSFILYRVQQETRSDLWVLPLTSGEKPFPFVQTRFDEREGQFSPDTRWVAYQSDESGRYQIYLQAFPGPGEPIPVTADGGTQPRWRPDGRELFYISPDEKLMALPVELSADGRRPRVLAPVPLFQTQISGGAVPGANRQQYSVSADGQQFLMSIRVADAEVAPPITMVLNWKPGRSIALSPR